MLALQMASTHHVAMECLARTSRAANFLELEANGALATKLLRTYALQLEMLTKLRRGGSQKVTVEHVHVYPGGQAIVGNANAPGGGAVWKWRTSSCTRWTDSRRPSGWRLDAVQGHGRERSASRRQCRERGAAACTAAQKVAGRREVTGMARSSTVSVQLKRKVSNDCAKRTCDKCVLP